jgi:hypothetical protein
MNLPKHHVRHIAASVGAVAVAAFATNAEAALTVELRMPDGGKRYSANPGEKFPVEIWATVSGSSTDLVNSYGLSSVHGSIVSRGAGWINVTGKKGDVAQYKGGQQTTALAPFAKSGEQPGAERDIDGDGDIDLGAPNQNDVTGFFVARADPQEYYGSPSNTGIPTADGKGVQWKIGRAEVTVAGNSGFADILFIPRRNADGRIPPEAALWYDDEGGVSAKNGSTGTIIVGAPLTVPEPASVALLLCPGLGLLRRRQRL